MSQYRSEIDGLRAVALCPFYFFMISIPFLAGDLLVLTYFFVISGFLITRILTNDLDEKKFSIIRLYNWRIRRIAPALFLVVSACFPFAWMWMPPDPLEKFAQGVIATTFFANNILLYLTSGYWELSFEFKPLVHTWSLAIQEQFYLFIPATLFVSWRAPGQFGTMARMLDKYVELSATNKRNVPGNMYIDILDKFSETGLQIPVFDQTGDPYQFEPYLPQGTL